MESGKYKNPAWNKKKQEEVENIIVEMGKQGISMPMIGLVLRDQYGIPTARIYGKKIVQILKEHNIEQKGDLFHVSKKLDILKKHLDNNKGDKKSKRALSILIGREKKLKKYCKEE